MTVITLFKTATGWNATFKGHSGMPQNIPLPLPFTAQAPAEMVRADLLQRFPSAVFVTKANSR